MIFQKHKPTFVTLDDGTIVCRGQCVFGAGEYQTAPVTADQIEAYRTGAYVQTAFSNLSADDREFILSGVSPTGWAKAFPDE